MYKSNSSQDNAKEQSLSLNDIHANIYNFDYPRKLDEDEGAVDLGDMQDTYEDD